MPPKLSIPYKVEYHNIPFRVKLFLRGYGVRPSSRLCAIAFSVLMLTACATNSGKDSGAGEGLIFAYTPMGTATSVFSESRAALSYSDSLIATPFAYNGTSGLRDFQVWATKPNEISSDSNHWTCVSYINSLAQDNPDSTFYTDPAFELSAFINDAVARFSGDGLNGKWTITSIEFGNEVVGGTGITEIRDWLITER